MTSFANLFKSEWFKPKDEYDDEDRINTLYLMQLLYVVTIIFFTLILIISIGVISVLSYNYYSNNINIMTGCNDNLQILIIGAVFTMIKVYLAYK